MTKRLTANDYRNQHTNALQHMTAIENRIKERLKELMISYPNVVVDHNYLGSNALLLAGNINIPEYFISDLIVFIEIIENHIENQSLHKQTKLKF